MENINVQVTQTLQPVLTVEIVQNLVPVMTAQVVIGGGGQKITFGDTLTGAGTPTDPVNVSNDVLRQISDNTEQGEQNASQIADIQNTVQSATEQISEIQSVIPATANAQNQLADQGFVNSSIQTATAYFRGDWATWADVPTDPAQYPADATGNRTPITNDYMVVIADEQENGGTWRYKYTGVWATEGKSGWQAEYQVNETPFTAAQNAAINSGVTAQAVADIAANKTAVANLQTSKQDKLTAGDNITIVNNVISASGGGGGASLPDQTGNAGKFLQTNGSEASWGEAVVNQNSGKSGSVIIASRDTTNPKNYGTNNVSIGSGSIDSRNYSVHIGYNSYDRETDGGAVGIGAYTSTYGFGIAIGFYAKTATNNAIQLSCDTKEAKNSDANTFKVANKNGNFEMMDANGNVPLERLTYVTNQIGDISTALTAILGE